MDIVKVRNALETLSAILNADQIGQLERMVGQGIINHHENKAEEKYQIDLKQLGIDMKLDVDQSDFEDWRF